MPDCWFDGTLRYVGGGSGTYPNYKSRIESRLAVPAPATIESRGSIDETSGWVTAKFKAVDPISYANMRSQFVLYEYISDSYPWIVRDMLPSHSVSLSAPGDSAVVTETFSVSPAWDHENLKIVVILESYPPSPKVILNSQLMPAAYRYKITTDDNALTVDKWGTAVFNTVVENTGSMGDTLDLLIDTGDLPPGWDGEFWIGGVPYTETDIYLDSGESQALEVHIDVAGEQEVGAAGLVVASRANPGPESAELYVTFVELLEILIVDDDGGAAHESYLTTALLDNGYPAMGWDADASGRLKLPFLSSFWGAFWTTAGGDATYLTSDDEEIIAAYLDGGGNLFLASMEFISSRTGPSLLMMDYLHIPGYLPNNGGSNMKGVSGDPISDGMNLPIDSGPLDHSRSDAMVASAPSDTIFKSGAGWTKAIKVDENDHKIVFLAFPFENVKTGAADPNNQRTLIGRVVDWFSPDTGVGDDALSGQGRLALRQNYPNPFNPVTRISFAVPESGDYVEVKVYDVLGRVVRTLVDGSLTAGEHSVVWDGKDDAGKDVASGVYFYRLSAAGETALRKMALLK